jgi:hypothetical protein
MLKIKIYLRDCNEYNRATIKAPEKLMTQERFEEDYRESDECFCEGDVYELCPYFGFREHVEVTLDGKVVFETEDMRSVFKKDEGNNCNFIPPVPDDEKEVNIWWYHDMKFNVTYQWNDVTEFDPEKVTISIGKDQNGKEFLDDIAYNNEHYDDEADWTDTGYGYEGPEFVYHPNQKFAETEEDAQ